MKHKTPKAVTAAALAALGLAHVSPAQWAVAGTVLAVSAAVVSPAFAQTVIPGVGTVVKRKPGDAGSIVVPSDNNGLTRLTGLEPGEYEVNLIGEARTTTLGVGRDGVLTFRAVAEDNGSGRRVEAVRERDVRTQAFDMTALFGYDTPTPRRSGGRTLVPAPVARFIDVNTSSAADITRLAPATSAEGARFIVSERERNGAYRDSADFNRRVCGRAAIDFGLAPARIIDVQIVAKGSGSPRNQGFKTAPAPRGQAGTFELYGVQHSCGGHVTLLR